MFSVENVLNLLSSHSSINVQLSPCSPVFPRVFYTVFFLFPHAFLPISSHMSSYYSILLPPLFPLFPPQLSPFSYFLSQLTIDTLIQRLGDAMAALVVHILQERFHLGARGVSLVAVPVRFSHSLSEIFDSFWVGNYYKVVKTERKEWKGKNEKRNISGWNCRLSRFCLVVLLKTNFKYCHFWGSYGISTLKLTKPCRKKWKAIIQNYKTYCYLTN